MVERIQRINRIRPVDSYSSGQSGLKQKRKKQAPSFGRSLQKEVAAEADKEKNTTLPPLQATIYYTV